MTIDKILTLSKGKETTHLIRVGVSDTLYLDKNGNIYYKMIYEGKPGFIQSGTVKDSDNMSRGLFFERGLELAEYIGDHELAEKIRKNFEFYKKQTNPQEKAN